MADGGGGPWFLGPVVNEDEGAGLGIGCGRTLSLVFPVRAGAGVVRAVMCDACWLPGAVLAVRVGYPGGVHFRFRMCGCACCRHSRVPKKHCWMPTCPLP